MKCLAVLLALSAVSFAQQSGPQNPPPGPPEVNWGKCPQLEPTVAEQRAKGQVIEQCLEKNPPPTAASGSEPTKEQLEAHRETITTCALQAEGWFNLDGSYKFDRAKKEIEGKNLKVAPQILAKHEDCTKEARENFPNRNIQQVQLYQACMDYHITQICDIKISTPSGSA